MSVKAKRGKRSKLRRNGKPTERRSGLVIAKSLKDVEQAAGRARYYRGPAGSLVVWKAGRFEVRPTPPDSNYLKSLAPCPKGLAERVNAALQKGQTRG